MHLRSKAREEFPRGWWQTGLWWFEGLRDLILNCLTAVAAVLFIREALRLVRDRDSAVDLSRRHVSTEGWTAGLVVGSIALGSTVTLVAQNDVLHVALAKVAAIVAIVWSLANVAVSVTALAVLTRSRIRHQKTWEGGVLDSGVRPR